MKFTPALATVCSSLLLSSSGSNAQQRGSNPVRGGYGGGTRSVDDRRSRQLGMVSF